MIYQFTLLGVTKSQNELDGCHWSKKHAEKVYWHDCVGYTLGRCPVSPGKARVSVVRVSKRLLDPLNVHAGLKWLIDATVAMGWATGDGPEDMDIEVSQRKCTAEELPHMELTIEYR